MLFVVLVFLVLFCSSLCFFNSEFLFFHLLILFTMNYCIAGWSFLFCSALFGCCLFICLIFVFVFLMCYFFCCCFLSLFYYYLFKLLYQATYHAVWKSHETISKLTFVGNCWESSNLSTAWILHKRWANWVFESKLKI